MNLIRYNSVEFALLVILIATLFSCNLEPCKDVPCFNGTPLEDGNDCFCLCDFGWRGEACTIENKCQTQSVVCLNGGVCNAAEGTCDCPVGFEGDSCEIVLRDRFLDNGQPSLWVANDTCLPDTYNYFITIEPASNSSSLNIVNLREINSPNKVPVFVEGYTITQRNNVDLGSIEISGLHGTLNLATDSIRVTYNTPTVCTGTWVRQ